MRDTTDTKTLDMIEGDTTTEPTRRGRPPKNGTNAMSAAERQREYRNRTRRAALKVSHTDEIANLSIPQLVTKLQKDIAWLKAPNNEWHKVTQLDIAATLDELRTRLVDLPI